MKKSRFQACGSRGKELICQSLSLYSDMTTTTTAPRQLDRASLQKVAEVFRVFSEPTRLGILQFLKGRTTSVNEIVAALETSQANISKQLRILYDADLLERKQQGNQVFYSIKEEMVFDLCSIVCDKLNRSARAGAEDYYEI
jgi:DNA-binding transcriptional ArsR family regulator